MPGSKSNLRPSGTAPRAIRSGPVSDSTPRMRKAGFRSIVTGWNRNDTLLIIRRTERQEQSAPQTFLNLRPFTSRFGRVVGLRKSCREKLEKEKESLHRIYHWVPINKLSHSASCLT